MILAFDTFYEETYARTAYVAFKEWGDAKPFKSIIEITENNAPYEPGEFYKRELPCILQLLNQVDLAEISTIIIDGYVYLSDQKKLGLGGYLYNSLEKKIKIIGVAKNNFVGIESAKKIIHRGKSKKALYITAAGMDLERAGQHIEQMHGEFRIPSLLKEVDRLSRENS